jgi:hypothetical protein
MTGRNSDEEKPLDPAVERVRRRLIRFMIVNLGILFVAFALVLGAIVYKISHKPTNAAGTTAPAAQVPNGSGETAGTIPLPEGARLLSESLSGSRALLDLELADRSRMLIFYDLEAGRVVGRYTVKPGMR